MHLMLPFSTCRPTMARLLLAGCLAILLPAPANAAPAKTPAGAYATLQWPELVPPEDRRKLLNPATINHGNGPDTQTRSKRISGDDVFNSLEASANPPPVRTIAGLHNRNVRMPGYIVPVDYDKTGKITLFYLVPYFGACIHVPPPPANQIVYVRYPQGFEPAALYEPFWVSGTLKVETLQSEMADSGYSMQGAKIEPYTAPAR